MIKITDKKGNAFDLPANLKISIERTNPFLSQQGSASLPISMPPTPNNLLLLDWPNKLDRAKKLATRIEVILQAGIYIDNCSMQIVGFSATEISVVLLIAETEFYAKARNVQLPDVFKDVVRTISDFGWTGGAVPVASKKMYLMINFELIMRGSIPNPELFVFEVGYLKVETGGAQNKASFQCLNKVSGNQFQAISEYPQTLADGTVVTLPVGYGMTPFLKENYVLEKVFEYFGYEFDSSVFPADFQKLCLVNNCVDAILTGELYYKQLVPTVSVYEYIDSFMKRFGCVFSFSSSTKKVKVIFLKDFLPNASSYPDYTKYKASRFTSEFETNKSVAIIQNFSYSDFNAGFSCFADFVNKYPTYTTITGFPVKYLWAYDILPENMIFPYSGIVYFPDLMKIYSVKWSGEKGTGVDKDKIIIWRAEYSLVFDFFNNYENRTDNETFEIDPGCKFLSEFYSPGMFLQTNVMLMMENKVRMLNGSIRYTNDKIIEKSDKNSDDCAIMPAFYLGKIDNDLGQPASSDYLFWYKGSIMRKKLDGTNLVSFNLLADGSKGLFETFYTEFDQILKKSFIPAQLEINLPSDIISFFDMVEPFMIDGQLLWPENMKYEITDSKIRVVDFKSRTLKLYED